ncbi:DUF922 domain-containing protein [Paraflavitalea pollutisoli]|uniref:DUF922 domain-containing protein n=1 Tax=Paraflavitalea pollutisoli TaxID=3034143 RepID=UPI0023ED4DDE|nr:DUF922 domain-containing protein [Paraflavitalea sp. H1-2-19X]
MRTLSLLLLMLLSTCLLPAQDTRLIRFRNEPDRQSLKHYHIVRIKDDRRDTALLGTVRSGLLGKKTLQLGFERGLTAALEDYMAANFRQDNGSTPIELHIDELALVERPGGLRTKVEVSFLLAFWIQGARTYDYKGTSELETMGDVVKHVEDMVRQNVRSSLLQFDDWWDKNRLLYEKNAPVECTVTVMRTVKDSGQIIYSPQRPLTYNDFIGTPDGLSLAAALTATAMSLRYSSSVDKGRINVDVQIAVYFDKARSWFNPKHRGSDKILAHEQKHFELTAIKAAELADTLRTLSLNKANYQEELEKVHAQKQRELDALQKQYDAETKHGTLVAVQQKWNRWVAEKLAARVW